MSHPPRHLFFCAVGGSGMLPLAFIMKARGHKISGSDRGRDQGRTPERFAWIEAQGIPLFPQDGSGITPALDGLVVSAAVEESVPDVQAARKLGLPIYTRAQLLSSLFNEAPERIAIAGTSGKSTTTGMLGWILHSTGHKPTIVNGASMKNFQTASLPIASAVAGDPALIVAEVDESDGSIAQYNPTIAVLNNISLDHKSMDELRALFGAYLGRADISIVNLDDAEAAALTITLPPEKCKTFSLQSSQADLWASDLVCDGFQTRMTIHRKDTNLIAYLTLPQPGRHNVANALAAISAAMAAGVPFAEAVAALSAFSGIARRMDLVGEARGVLVIDDFAHNPDKIAATLSALDKLAQDRAGLGPRGRVTVLFQPHGYGPLNLMRKELAACFAQGLTQQDRLYITNPLYLGGTTARKVTAQDLVNDIVALGGQARLAETREAAAAHMAREARAGDLLIIMGARDDTLPALAADLLGTLLTTPENAG